MRASGPSRRRVSASATSSAKAKTSSQKPPPGETRAKVSPSGVRKVAARPIATARTARTARPVRSRTSAGVRSRATMMPPARTAMSEKPASSRRQRREDVAAPRPARCGWRGTARRAEAIAPAAAMSAIRTPSLSSASQRRGASPCGERHASSTRHSAKAGIHLPLQQGYDGCSRRMTPWQAKGRGRGPALR